MSDYKIGAETENDVESIVHHTRQAKLVVQQEDSERALYAVPDGVKLVWDDPNKDDTLRARGSVELHDAASFVLYVNDHRSARSRIYCDANYQSAAVTFTAVLNEQLREDFDYRDFRAVYQPRVAEEWRRWTANDRQPKSQVQFATLLEDNLQDIASVDGMPTGAQMLEMALNLEITQDSKFKSAIRIASGGVSLQYVDQEDEATLKKMSLFDRFALGIPAYFNGTPYQLVAKLRHKISAGTATFWYELIRPDLVVADAIQDMIAKIGEETKLPVLFGKP